MQILTLMEQSPVGAVFVALLGLIWGSFFNVCIARLPDEKSLMGRSQCPKCGTLIRWFQNIPVFSYLALRGRCSNCKTRISIQYPLVEIVTALLYLWLYSRYGLSQRFLVYSIFVSSLVVVTVINLYHQIIPDEISLPGIILGFLAQLWIGDVDWLSSLLGILLGGGSFLLIAYAYEKTTGREGLGGGDIKLLGMFGAWLGYQSILPIVVVSSAVGTVVGIFLMVFQKKTLKTAIPFGPFLALAALAFLAWQDTLLSLMYPTPY